MGEPVAFLDDETIGRRWKALHPDEAEANNAGQMTYEGAARAVSQEPWTLDYDQLDATLDAAYADQARGGQ